MNFFKNLSTQWKLALLAAATAIIAAILPVFLETYISREQPALLTIVDINTKSLEVGASIFTVLDLKLENAGDEPGRITQISLNVEKSFQFFLSETTQFRVPVSASYDISLADSFEGDRIIRDLFHEVAPHSADRIQLVVGGGETSLPEDGVYQQNDPSYISMTTISLIHNGIEVAESKPVIVFTLAQDSGVEEESIKDDLPLQIDALPKIGSSEIQHIMQEIGVESPTWLSP